MASRILIGYATRTGAARDIAGAVAEELRSRGDAVTLACLADDPDVNGAELVVLGSGINAGSWYPEAGAWVDAHRDELASVPVAVFNTCLNAADPTKREEALGYNRSMAERVGAVAEESFAGRYEKARVGFFQRLLLLALRQPERDLVDRAAARDWARRLPVPAR